MSNEQHIASAFDRDLEAIQAQIMKMGGLVEAAIRDGAKALETRDEELAEQVRAGDKAIDALEEQINDEAARVIALRAPTAIDLRTVLTVMKIAANLERIGDYAKNMAKRTSVLVQMPPIDGTRRRVRRMAQEVEMMLQGRARRLYPARCGAGRGRAQRDHEVDQMYNALFREFLTFMMEDPRNITACMHLHFIAKNIERMGDHVTSIAEQVIYLVTGEMPDDSRAQGRQARPVSSDARKRPMIGAEQPMVLVVEDEPAQREVLAYNLEAEGFRVGTRRKRRRGAAAGRRGRARPHRAGLDAARMCPGSRSAAG